MRARVKQIIMFGGACLAILLARGVAKAYSADMAAALEAIRQGASAATTALLELLRQGWLD